jgi:hypothetical protein
MLPYAQISKLKYIHQVSQLEVEIQGIPQSVKPPYTSRLKQAKADLTKYKKLSKELHSQVARSDLIGSFKNGSSSSDDPYGERSDRTRLLTGTETLEDGTRRIAESTSLALETENQGADILRSLRGQREQIENSRNTVCADYHKLERFPDIIIASNSGYPYRPSEWNYQRHDSTVSFLPQPRRLRVDQISFF